jgi:hypothetical protein
VTVYCDCDCDYCCAQCAFCKDCQDACEKSETDDSEASEAMKLNHSENNQKIKSQNGRAKRQNPINTILARKITSSTFIDVGPGGCRIGSTRISSYVFMSLFQHKHPNI